MPEMSPAIKKMLGGLPIAGIKDDVQNMAGTLKNTSCGGGLKGCYMANPAPCSCIFSPSIARSRPSCWYATNTWACLRRKVEQACARPLPVNTLRMIGFQF